MKAYNEVAPHRLGPKKRRVDVLFFGESPGTEEAREGKAFIGPAGQLMQTLIQDQLKGKSVVLDNVCPRYLQGDKPDAEILHEFDNYRAERIKQLKPRVMVLLGKIAGQAFRVTGSPTGNTGRVQRIAGMTTVLSVHPAFILRQPTAIDTLRLAFDSIRACLKPKTKIKIEKRPTGKEWGEKGERWLEEIEKEDCSLDLETSSLDPKDGRVLCASITALCEFDGIQTLSITENFEQLAYWWPRGPRIVHNAKFELAWMRSLGAKDPKILYDTMVQAWLINEEGPRDLDRLVTTELGWKPYWLDIDKTADWSTIPMKTLTEYNCYDAAACYQLHWQQRDAMSTDQRALADRVFVPLIGLLLDMEASGLHVNRERLEELHQGLDGKIKDLQALTAKTFPGLNPRSVPQMRELLFERLNLPVIKKTKTGPSTDKEVLEILARKEPKLKSMARSRELQSLRSRVTRPWLRLTEKEPFIRSTFNLCITPTARLTSTEPNLQNIDREGPQRVCLTSRWPRGRIVQADFEQHELRCYAAVTEARGLLKALKVKDPHQATADEMSKAGVPTDRSRAKNLNFAVIYGASAWKLEKEYHIPVATGKQLIRQWKELYPEIALYHQSLERDMAKGGLLENCFGLTRHLNNPLDVHQVKQAYNFDGQSVAVIICYRAMLKVAAELRKLKMKSLLILQIHDSIVVDTYPGETTAVRRILKKAMLDKTGLPPELKDLPLAIDIKSGETL